MKKLKVLYTPINAIGVGGLSTIAFRLGTNMNSEKINIDFFATYNVEGIYKKIVENQNGKIFEFNIKEKKGILKKKIFIIKSFYKVLKTNKYDIIHIHIDNSYNGLIYGIIAKYFCKGKIIFHSHNASISGKLKNILHIIFKPFLGVIGDEFATCSQKAANWMFPKYILKKKNIKFIENGIDMNKYLFNEKTRKKYRDDLNLDNNFVIGHIGRFETQKNHEFLINIFNEVHKKQLNSKLLLIGTGSLKNKIIQQVKDFKLEKEVIFLQNRNDVKDILQACDIFLLPSLYEGLPLVAVEAQTSGVNVVLSDSITKEAKIVPNVKYISLNKSAEFWAKEILKLNVKNDRNAYKQKLLDSNFNIKNSVLNLQKFYLEIMNKE